MLPSRVARDLDDDPNLTTLRAWELLVYARAYHDFERYDDEKDLRHWQGSTTMRYVREHVDELHKLDVEKRKAADAAREREE